MPISGIKRLVSLTSRTMSSTVTGQAQAGASLCGASEIPVAQ